MWAWVSFFAEWTHALWCEFFLILAIVWWVCGRLPGSECSSVMESYFISLSLNSPLTCNPHFWLLWDVCTSQATGIPHAHLCPIVLSWVSSVCIASQRFGPRIRSQIMSTGWKSTIKPQDPLPKPSYSFWIWPY